MSIPPFLDAHHHLWDFSDFHVWINADPPLETMVGDYERIRRDYLPAHFRADAGSVRLIGSVHVQAEWDPDDPVGETAWLSQLAHEGGLPSAIVGYVDLSSDDAPLMLDEHERFANFRGIRQMLNWDQRAERSFAPRPHMMMEPEWRRGFHDLQNRGLIFDMQVLPHQFDEAIDLLQEAPDSAVAINHLGLPIERDPDSMDRWARGLTSLARFPNVNLKLSGVGLLDHEWTAESIREPILRGIDIFGPERCMFGSNFPVDKLYSDYTSLLSSYDAVVADFSAEERRSMFSQTAARFYMIDVMALATEPGRSVEGR